MKSKISSEHFWHEINKAFDTRGGVYVLSCTDVDGTPVTIGRLLAQDPNGVLYIGMAKCFLERVIELKKSLAPEYLSQNHECGSRHKSHKLIVERFPYERLQIELIGADDPRQAEQEALKNYLARFGELPPFNRVG